MMLGRLHNKKIPQKNVNHIVHQTTLQPTAAATDNKQSKQTY